MEAKKKNKNELAPNGRTGEARLAKPSVERLPKAKTPFRLLLIVLTEGGLWMSREVLKKD